MISTTKAFSSLIKYLRNVPRFNMNHIKDMREQNLRVKAEQADEAPAITSTDRVYKPSYTIEFNREGQVLLYSANPIKNATIYFKYPYILCKYNLIQMNLLSPQPSSTMSSILSIWFGTLTAWPSMVHQPSQSLESGTTLILNGILKNYFC